MYGNFFLIGARVYCAKLNLYLEKSIPHWCSYSSKQQYLSASIAGILGVVKYFVVLNCEIFFIFFFIQKCIFEEKFFVICTINGNILPVPYSLWHFRAESVL